MAWGMYGLRMEGFTDAAALLVPAEASWPSLQVVRAQPDSPPRRPHDLPVHALRLDDRAAEVWFSDHDGLTIDQPTMCVQFITKRELSDDALAHPYLALPVAIASHWLGRLALHGSAFELNGRAWAMLGKKEAGKSSIVGWAFSRGHPTITDDLLVADGTTLFSGPRCIDLRDEAAAVLGGDGSQRTADRPKWRLRPGQVPGSLSIGGLVHLEWGPRVVVEPLEPVDRLRRIAANFVLGPDLTDAAAYLELASLPAFRFARPRDVRSIDGANDQLLDALG
jgi:hypothetical protein